MSVPGGYPQPGPPWGPPQNSPQYSPQYSPLGPPYGRAARPDSGFARPFAWTCVFGFVSATLATLAIAGFTLVFWLILADAFDGGTGDFPDPDAHGVAVVALVFVVVWLVLGALASASGAGMLALLRLIRDYRTWPAPLQGLTAQVAATVVGSTLTTAVSYLVGFLNP